MNMFAVIKTGGKQYKVVKDDILKIESLSGSAGDTVAIEEVLMVGDGDNVTVGSPLVEGASVAAEVLEQARGPKIIVFKKRRRKNSRRRGGHRQDLTVIRITDILTGGKKVKAGAKPKKAEEAPKAETPKAEAPKAAAAPEKFEALSGPRGEADDLKKISGLGPKLEQTLNGLGIYHYWQVAAFTADDIEKIDAQLTLKGRIEFDDWMSQAKALMDEKE